MRVIDGQYGIFSPESTGVFKVDPGTNKINVTVAQNHQGDNHAFFDLSGGNSIYGSSDTVQPKTMRGYWLIRFEPNIKSWLTAANGYYFVGNTAGAFVPASYATKKTANSYQENSSLDSGYGGFNMDAQSFNPLYGAAETVQPKTLRGQFLIRYE